MSLGAILLGTVCLLAIVFAWVAHGVLEDDKKNE
jgi:hypothetical protein